MNPLIIDAFSIILTKLSDQEKLFLLVCSKEIMAALEKYVLFNESIKIKKILNSHFFHCFTNIIVDDYLMYTSQKTVGLYNQPLLLPKKLKTMKIADDYVKSIDGYIPSTVTCLILSHYFKEPLNDIPSSITHLTFGAHFNSYLTLSSTITHLKFGHHFDQKIINFPPNLVSLT